MLPLVRGHKSDLRDEFTGKLQRPLNSILRQYSINPKIRLETIRSEAQPSAKTYTYALVIAEWAPDCLDNWKAAGDALIVKIRQLGYSGLKVMIADDRAMYSPDTAGLRSGETLLAD